ncbi:MAG TPA: dienelactone hydrolase family protein [Armatimonadota bacterium]
MNMYTHAAQITLSSLFLFACAGSVHGTASTLSFQSAGRTIRMAKWTAGTPGQHPAVMLLHGGGGPQLIENDPNYTRYPLALARAGFDVYMPYYWEATAPSDDGTPANIAAWLRSAENALAWINAQRTTKPGSVSVIGLSYGAFLGLCLSAQDPGVKAMVSFYGWLPQDRADAVKRMPPTLILHGSKDVLVDVKEAGALDRLLSDRKVQHEVHIYPGENHGFVGEPLEDSERRLVAFLTQHGK